MTETPGPALRLQYAALSDVGRVRKDNQDSGFVSEHLLVVADGVGGAARGDIASSTAVQQLRRLDAAPAGDLLEAVAGAIHRAHDRIAELVDEDPALAGTSTTLTAALFDGHRVGVGHIGDSRGYLFRDGTLTQLTKDHTFVQSLIDEGRITEEESRTHPHRNLILRAVDGVHETDPDLFLVDLAPGDRLFLCSDGACGVLTNSRMADILGSGSPDYAAVELVRSSLEAGSSDNVTCIVADVVTEEQALAAAADDETHAAAITGPMLVGAAAEQPRRAGKAGVGSLFRGHRSGDTGELDPVPDDIPPGAIPADPVDPEQARYAPRPPRRFAWLRRLAILAIVVGLIWAATAAAYAWTQRQYFVAADGAQVTIYRGVQADLPGFSLSTPHQSTEVPLAALPELEAGQVQDGIGADDLSDARSIVSQLEQTIEDCDDPAPDASSEPRPGATSEPSQGDSSEPAPTGDPSRDPTGDPSRDPTGDPSPGATGTGTSDPTSSAPSTRTPSETQSPADASCRENP